MDKDAILLGDDLLNIILKANLKSKIASKKLKDKDFVFALMTGVEKISTKGIVTIGYWISISLKNNFVWSK